MAPTSSRTRKWQEVDHTHDHAVQIAANEVHYKLVVYRPAAAGAPGAPDERMEPVAPSLLGFERQQLLRLLEQDDTFSDILTALRAGQEVATQDIGLHEISQLWVYDGLLVDFAFKR